MNKTESKFRRKLNVEQLEVLELLYKFRFGSNDLFAQYFGKKDRSFVFKRLKILQERGLIGKRFDSGYRLQGKPAAYFLLPAGARVLQAHRPDRVINVKTIYKDRTVSEDFVEYCFRVFSIYCQLKARYGNELKFLTKVQLVRYSYFSEFVPNVYFRLEASGTERDFFLEYLQESKPFFTIVRRLKQYSDYFDSGEWEDGTASDFPPVLLVCDTARLQKRLLGKAEGIIEDAGKELAFYVTAEEELRKSESEGWHNLLNPEESRILKSI